MKKMLKPVVRGYEMFSHDNLILHASDDTMVCYCGKVDKKTLLGAIAAGHDTVKKLIWATGICPENSDCKTNNPSGGCCLCEVNALLRDYMKRTMKLSKHGI